MLPLLLTALVTAAPQHVQATLAELRAEPLTLAGASRAGWNAFEVGDEAAAALWAERQLVLEGEAPLADPVSPYREAGRVHELREIPGPVHLAACDGQRVEYLGSFDDGWDFVGGWRAQIAGPRDPVETDDIERFLEPLTGHPWTAYGPEGDRPRQVGGDSFARPFIVPAWNEEYRTSGDEIADRGAESTLVLGTCSQAGEVYFSQLLDRARPSRPGTGEIERLTASLAPRREGFEVSAVDTGAFSGLREAVADFSGPMGDGQAFVVRRWIVQGDSVRGDAEVAWYAGDPGPIPDRTWLSPAYRVLIGLMPTTSTEKSRTRGYVILVWHPSGARFVSVMTEGHGC